MKKILFILFAILCFTSCFNDGVKRVTNHHGGICGTIVVKEFSYNEHSYLEFKDTGYNGHGFVHNPDCKCIKDSI